MHSFTVWKQAAGPNYDTNIDQEFPYSDLPHQEEYKLLKIPVSLNDLIKHVDYFGEGRVVFKGGIRGFPNCYNINHQYRLVHSGPDKDKKIPNRIPVRNYYDSDTSAYIKENSVLIVTVAASYLNSSCIADIARIVNNDHGKVVVYELNDDSLYMSELAGVLKTKGMFPCVKATLPKELQGLTYYDNHVAFLNSKDILALKDELYNDVAKGNYDSALNITRSIVSAGVVEDLNVIAQKLVSEAPRKFMFYAYKLWQGGDKDVVRNHFPKPLQHIFNEDPVTIVNRYYGQALKLDLKINSSNNDRAVWGDKSLPITSGRLSWQFIPSCKGNDLTFELYNVDCDMFMRMDDHGDNVGDKQCWGSTKTEEDSNDDERFKYFLEPVIVNKAETAFLIINVRQKQALKLEVKRDSVGDRLLWGNNIQIENDRRLWSISKWSSSSCSQ